MTLAAGFDTAARAFPNATALVDDGQTLSYAAMSERVGGLAGALRETYKLKRGDRVAIFLENHIAFYVVLFACWRAGLSVVPVNAKLHPKELHWIVDNSEASLLVVSDRTRTVFNDASDLTWPAVLNVDSAAFAADFAHEPAPLVDIETHDQAWLFYTSGTTGRPKGAQLSHRALLFMCHAYYADIDQLSTRDTCLHAAPLTHGSGLYGLANFLRGGCNVIIDGFDPPKMFDAIATYPSCSFFAAPTMLTRMINAPEAATADVSNLRTITYGGAPMYAADLSKALALFGRRMFHLYGQGESPMTITGLAQQLHAATADPDHAALLGSTGIARTGVRVRVVRDDGHDADVGEVGEVITKSDALMSGYWRNDAANATALRDGWLWTGDLGSLDARGFLTLTDRAKDLIVSGGTNIYPREIEEVLLRHDDVLECAVVGTPHPDWGETVTAFVVTRADAKLSEATLDALCLDNIARFKRPKTYRFIPSLPKNNYGKILKTELAALAEGTTSVGGTST